MTPEITPRDWEAISAYLDDQLAPKERQKLEARLERESHLRRTLEELRQMKQVLRAQPVMRAPRNFTISPQMAGIRQGARTGYSPFPLLRLASVLAAVFFVLLVAGDLVSSRLQPASVARVKGWEIFGRGGGGGGGGGEVPPPQAVQVVTEEVAAEQPAATIAAEVETVAKAVEVTVTQAITEGVTLALMPTATPILEAQTAPADTSQALTPTPEPTMLAMPIEEPSPTPELAVEPTAPDVGAEEKLQQEPGEAAIASPAPLPPEAGALQISLVRILQILLALLAVGAGIAAYLARRSTS